MIEVSLVECDICNHRWVAVRPEGLDKLECPNCGNIASFENIKTSDMEELTPESQEIWDNLGKPIKPDIYKAKYEVLSRSFGELAEHYAAIADETSKKVDFYAQKEWYFRAEVAKKEGQMASNIVIEIMTRLGYKVQKVVIIDDTL